jgi:hypothetical protein
VANRESRLPWIRRGWHHAYQQVRNPELVESPTPVVSDPPLQPLFGESHFYQYPALGVGLLRSGRIATRDGVVMEPSGGVLEDFNYFWERNPDALPIFERLSFPRAEKKSGAYVSILSPDTAAPNYFHWMAVALPRLAAIAEAGIREYQLIVPAQMRQWQKDSLSRLGYSEWQLAPFEDGHWQLDALFAPTLIGYPGMCHPWSARWLREKFGVENGSAGKRKIYISRANARYRKVVNEAEVIAALQPLGFEVVCPEKLSFAAQLELFSGAGWIVSTHGAGLTNALFAPRGAKVLECISSEAEYANLCYYSICCAVGHAYGAVCVDYPSPRVPPVSELRRREDYRIPVDRMLAAIQKMNSAG